MSSLITENWITGTNSLVRPPNGSTISTFWSKVLKFRPGSQAVSKSFVLTSFHFISSYCSLLLTSKFRVPDVQEPWSLWASCVRTKKNKWLVNVFCPQNNQLDGKREGTHVCWKYYYSLIEDDIPEWLFGVSRAISLRFHMERRVSPKFVVPRQASADDVHVSITS